MINRLIAPAILAAGLTVAGAASAQTVGMATSNPGSLYHGIGSAVAKAANESGLNTTIQPATSPNQYLPLVNANEMEFGVSNLEEFLYAYEGLEWFNGRANPELRVVALLMPLQEAIFVRKDSDIKTIADLKGKPMVDGYTAQNTILPHLDAMYATAGMTRDDMQPVQVPSVVGGADAFMAGDSVGFIFSHGAGKVREADASVGGLRALTVPDTPEALAALREHWKTASVVTIEPGPAYPGVLETGTYWEYPQTMFTNASVSDDVVYAMTKAVYENQELLASSFPPFKKFDPATHMVGDVAPGQYHPGAIKFYKEAGLWKE
ncbi:TAXI family TRAP transporter solute-binding subunit [Amorphus coralli]|uniref:TAXI family TRAP transporter solute-binding subunit n=1 Tax=Amorphus coralli TaxID=340680 RepID=UPI00035D700D|nr:TAXI family TRAP transporter solute-binding subunit [Amorphus coralli]